MPPLAVNMTVMTSEPVAPSADTIPVLLVRKGVVPEDNRCRESEVIYIETLH